jgi:hypothetical protein
MQQHWIGHSERWHWAGILGVLLLGFALTVHGLDATTLWNDETWTIDATEPDESIGTLIEKVREDVHPPLFFVELYGWRHITGQSVFELRYFSVLLTLLGVALVYRAGRDLFSPLAGWIAALIFALHDLIRVYAQEVRHYPQFIMLGVLVVWLYWRFWRRPTRGRGIVFVLAGAALLWTHYWGGFVLLALAVHAVVTKTVWPSPLDPLSHRVGEGETGTGLGVLRPYILAFIGIGLLFAPWLPSLAHQMTVERPEGLPHALENSWTVYKALAFQLLGVPEIFWIVLVIAGTAGGLMLTRWRPSPASLLPALVAVVPVALTILLNAVYPSLSPRSLAVVIPAAALLAGHALAQFGRSERALMVTFIVLHGLATTSSIPNDRAPWPEVADFLARNSAAGDVVLMEVKDNAWNNLEEYTLAYYLDHSGAGLRAMWSEDRRLKDPDGFSAALRDQLEGVNGVWVAKWGWEYYDLRADLSKLGFVETMPPLDFTPFNAIPVQVWRFDRVPRALLATFDDRLRLGRAEVTARDGWVTVDLLWSPTQAPERDYTVSAFLLDANGVSVAQHDGYPLTPTSAWQANGLYFDSHTIVTDAVAPGSYRVGVKVYRFTDASFQTIEIAPASDCSSDPNCEFVIIGNVLVQG